MIGRRNPWVLFVVISILSAASITAEKASDRSLATIPNSERLNYHTAPSGSHPMMMDQHHYRIPSLLNRENGKPVESPEEWFNTVKPGLIMKWIQILGKLSPSESDRKWFPSPVEAIRENEETLKGYVRQEIRIRMETDFLQPHVLLIPRGQGPGPFPAVIAWTSTTPDYRKPEEWWGQWLARNGFVVLNGWSFIRNYRDERSYRNQVNELVYDRFGHWLPMAKMVHDVEREVEFLRQQPQVDADRIGFMGFSLSAKTALYVAAFSESIKATVAVDPHVALHGNTNYGDPWYLDWKRQFPTIHTDDYPVTALRNTPWSLLDSNPSRPGFERNHHELMALCAPRALLLMGCSMDRLESPQSDNLQSWGYFNRAMEVYQFLGIPERFQFSTHTNGHRAVDASTDRDWQNFLNKWLKEDSPNP